MSAPKPKLPPGWVLEEEEAEVAPVRLPPGWVLEESGAPAPVPAPKPRALDVTNPEAQAGTALQSFAQGGSFGFADELRGVSGALQELGSRGPLGRVASLAAPLVAGPLARPLVLAQTAAAPQLLGGSSRELAMFPGLPLGEALKARYQQDRDEGRQDLTVGRKANPKTALAAEVAGALAVPLPKGQVAATVGKRMLDAGKTGAAMGALSGAGASDAEDVEGVAQDAAVGGGLGFGLGATVAPVAEVVSSRVLRPAAERLANTQAVKAILGTPGLLNRLRQRLGIRNEQGVQELGQQIRDLGILGNVIPRNVKGINEANQRVIASSGSAIGQGIDAADQVLASGAQTNFNPQAAAKAFESGVDKAADRTGITHQLAPSVKESAAVLTEPNVSTFRKLWDTKAGLGEQAFAGDATRLNDRMSLLRSGQQSAAREIESQLESAIGPDEMAAVRDAMKRYSTAQRVAGSVEDAATRFEAKAPIGLSDHQAAQTLGVTGGPGMAIAGLSSLVRSRGNAAAALYTPRAARAVGSVGRLLGGGAAKELPMSVADPLGPLRQYLSLEPDEQAEASAEALKGGM